VSQRLDGITQKQNTTVIVSCAFMRDNHGSNKPFVCTAGTFNPCAPVTARHGVSHHEKCVTPCHLCRTYLDRTTARYNKKYAGQFLFNSALYIRTLQ